MFKIEIPLLALLNICQATQFIATYKAVNPQHFQKVVNTYRMHSSEIQTTKRIHIIIIFKNVLCLECKAVCFNSFSIDRAGISYCCDLDGV